MAVRKLLFHSFVSFARTFTGSHDPSIMTFDLRSSSFEEFERFIFDHPSPTDERPRVSWFWGALESAASDPLCEPERQVAHLRRLLSQASQLPRRYSPEQLCQGFWLVFGPAGTELFQAPLYDSSIPWPQRAACFTALVDLYEGLFASEPCGDAAYMLFDGRIRGRYGYPHPHLHLDGEDGRTRAHLFGVLQRILALPSASSQRGALHGLGHLMRNRHPVVSFNGFSISGEAEPTPRSQHMRLRRRQAMLSNSRRASSGRRPKLSGAVGRRASRRASMPSLATRQLLRRHAIAFAISFGALTSLVLAQYMAKRLRRCVRAEPRAVPSSLSCCSRCRSPSL